MIAPALLGAALLAASGGCARGPQPLRGALHEGEVSVAVVVENDAVAVTFTPDRPDLHLYAMELVPERAAGLGVPTRVTVAGALSATGAPVADRTSRELQLEALGVTLPVYPPGPVTIRVPVQRGDGDAAVTVSYAACTAAVCFPPVLDRAVPLST